MYVYNSKYNLKFALPILSLPHRKRETKLCQSEHNSLQPQFYKVSFVKLFTFYETSKFEREKVAEGG